MGAADERDVARPRIRRQLRVIALGLVLLPSLAVAYLVKAVSDADARARQQERQERRDRVQDRAENLAGALAMHGDLFPPEAREHYALREAVPPLELLESIDIDGRCADWRVAGLFDTEPCRNAEVSFDRIELLADPADAYDPADFSVSLMSGERESYLYLFVRVRDDALEHRGRALDSGDQLRLVAAIGASPPSRFVVSLEPPRAHGQAGAVTTYQVGRSWAAEVPAPDRLPWGDYRLPAYRRPYGAWRPSAAGYDVELRLPLRTLGPGWREAELGLAVVDVDREEAGSRRLVRKAIWAVPQREGTFGLLAPDAERFRAGWADLDWKLRRRSVAIFDARGRELFSSFAAPQPQPAVVRDQARALLAALAPGDATSVSHAEEAFAAARIVSDRDELLGFVVERDEAAITAPHRAAIVRESPVTVAALGAALLLLFLLLAYTRGLSRRILALIDDVGAERHADDEIGALSRRLSELVERVQADRDYLERLPGILGHETLGPLGVIRMFVEDLEQRGATGGLRRQAARRAIHSIEELIEDLREATSLEDALARGERISIELVEFLREYASAYAEANEVTLEVDLPAAEFPLVAIEGRIEQLLDKLLDNATAFSCGAAVRLSADRDAEGVRIRVENPGSQLPEGAGAENLFEPLWSGRKRTTERHLGLGLYVARIIAEHHGGGIRAWNAGPQRVVFETTLKGARSEPADGETAVARGAVEGPEDRLRRARRGKAALGLAIRGRVGS